ncbi:MAG TPA: flippase [Candidatus Portnoybacteria bacterium]|nr:flippase [Candidatus Portnoybacteria bacterium]
MKNLIKSTILKNTFWLGSSEIISRFLRFFLVVSAARILGVTEYGQFSFVSQILFFSAIFTDLGISPILTRELSKNWSREKKNISSTLLLKTILILLTWLAIFVLSFAFIHETIIRIILIILSFDTVSGAFIKFINALFEARQKMRYEAWGTVLRSFLIVISGLFILFNYPSIINLSWTYAIGSILTAIFLTYIYQKTTQEKLLLSIDTSNWKKILSISWPVAMTVVFAAIYHSMDSIMLGFWGMMTENGWYSAAYKIMDISLTPIIWISSSFFPVLSQKFKNTQGKEAQKKIFVSHLSILTILGFPITIGGIMLAPQIINLVYGSAYQPSVLAFQILMGALLLIYLNNTFGQTLLAANFQKYSFGVTVIGAFINIALNWILIPRYSLYGAATATFLTYLFDFITIMILTKKLVNLSFWQEDFLIVLLKTILSTGLMAGLIWYLTNIHFNTVLIIILGAIFYGLLTFFLNQRFILLIIQKNKGNS